MSEIARFKLELRSFMDRLPQREKTLDEIYADAEGRQTRLIAKLFDLCVSTVCESGKYSDEDLHRRGLLKDDGSMITAAAFAMPDLEGTDNYDTLYRERMTSFLKRNSPVYIYDKGIKSYERSAEKVDGVLAGEAGMMKDINRATIVSEDYDLLKKTIDQSNKIFKSNLCSKSSWDMKSFGLLSRSQYLNNEGFAAEIHFNERHQIELGEVVTHSVYEVFREDATTEKGKKRFEEKYSSLSREIKGNFFERKKGLSDEMVSYTLSLLKQLDDVLLENADAPIEQKKKALINFNRRSHQEVMDKFGDTKWKAAYIATLKVYNRALPEEKKIPLFAEGLVDGLREYRRLYSPQKVQRRNSGGRV